MPAAVVMATVAEPVARRMSAASSQARNNSGTCALHSDVDHGLRDAAILQNAAEATARSDQQRDGGRGRKAFVGEAQDGIAGEAAQCAEREEADQHADEESEVVVAGEMQRPG